MSYNQGYPPPPPPQGGYAPQPQQGYGQPPAPQQANASGWVDNRTIIGGWSAAQYGMQPGKHIEYKVYSKPTNKGGVFKSVSFFKPFQKKNGTIGEGFDFSFNMMKELVEKINHFINNFCDEKGFFVWQPGGVAQGQGQLYPQQQPPPPPQQYGPPQYQQQPAGYGGVNPQYAQHYPQPHPGTAPQYPQPPQPQYQQPGPAAPQSAPAAPPPPPGHNPWP